MILELISTILEDRAFDLLPLLPLTLALVISRREKEKKSIFISSFGSSHHVN